MSVQIEELSPCRRKLTVEVPADSIQREYDEALGVFVKQATLPGFRPGKAPVHLVKAKYHKDILQRLRDHLVPKSYREAVEENKLDVVQIIDMDENIEVLPGKPLSYSVTLDIRPEISLPAYKGIALTKNKVEVTDADIQARVDELRQGRARYEDVSGRNAARGDMVQVDLTATVDGVPMLEAVPAAKGLASMSDFWMQASAEAFLPELGEGVAGMAVGETREIPVTFDERFTVEGLRGRTAVYTATLKAVRARVLPELNEAFCKELGVENEEKLREAVSDVLHSEKDRAEQDRLRQEIERFLMDNTHFELPESMVAEAASRQVRRIADGLGRQGLSEEQILAKKEEIVESANQAARHSVKLRLILHQIARQENIKVSDSDIQREIRMMAYSWGMKPNDLEKRVREDANLRNDLAGDILVRKTLNYLLDEANVSS